MPREVHDKARRENPDGIGVMSESGVARFLGRRSGKRAWRHIRGLAERGEPYGVHYRWATHGAVMLRNTHPFQQGAVHVMHNGIIDLTAEDATAEDSDTVIFVRDYMPGSPDPVKGPECKPFYERIEALIGRGSKLLVMGESGVFKIVNEFAGVWDRGLWYSNEYSLPGYHFDNVTATSWSLEEDDDYGTAVVVKLTEGWMTEEEEDFACRGCGTRVREEDLWVFEECPYCGTVRVAQ
jgi:hypothetical protein